jgi:anhydro-N-acetylmuramic acid kinase
MSELYVGLLSGTSMDAIDAALVDFSGESARLTSSLAYPFPDSLKSRLQKIVSSNVGGNLDEAMALDYALGDLFAEAVLALLNKAGISAGEIRAIGSHGQTVRHRPPHAPGSTLQLGDPNRIAGITGITTVADFRRMDMAHGGQGAPLAPAFHQAMLAKDRGVRAVVNLGGIANITVLNGVGGGLTGFDSGPANGLLDDWASRCLSVPYDENGAWAARGVVREELLEKLLADAFFAAKPPKSTGRDYFHLGWLEARLTTQVLAATPTEDVQATLCALTARTVGDAILACAPEVEDVIVCGGGVHNDELRRQLQLVVEPAIVRSSQEVGLDPDWVEAMLFAWLAKARLENRSYPLHGVTGARKAAPLGAIYAGS